MNKLNLGLHRVLALVSASDQYQHFLPGGIGISKGYTSTNSVVGTLCVQYTIIMNFYKYFS